MTLPSGSRLGPFEITDPLGSGGMGEVYRARDTRLDRTVALKVLPSHLSQDPELRQRLLREAKAISSLSHPHICALYDVGFEDGLDYLVMEYLEGETLAERLARGPLPTDQVLRYGREIAEALDRAHRQGVVHRDLKPANVMLTKSGVKLLDFGLAKLREKPVESGISSLPTKRAEPLTERGTVLGTFPYMSPEQHEGKDADARADIFALGAVLYEMATGRRAFGGGSRASIVAAILAGEPPPISSVQKMTPPALERLVKKCLAKDPDERWQSAHDVASELAWIAEGGSQAGAPAAVTARRRLREGLALAAAGLLLLVSAALAWRMAARRTESPLPPVRFTVSVPDAGAFQPALSSDGTKLVFVAIDRNQGHSLRLRDLSSSASRELPGTGGARTPFFSPDGGGVGFFARGRLKRLALPNGPITELCDMPRSGAGFWTPDGLIAFEHFGVGLSAVPAAGGPTRVLSPLDSAARESFQSAPQLLPDGRWLYTAERDRGKEYVLMTLDAASGKKTAMRTLPSTAIYAAGRLLYRRGGQLVSEPVDGRTFASRGDPVVIAAASGDWYDARDGRVLAYEVPSPVETQLSWYDRSGASREPLGEEGNLKGYFFSLDLSPDGRRLAYEKTTGDARNIWVADLVRHTATRLTFGAAHDDSPVFSPDGSRIAFDSDQAGSWDVYARPADGSGSDTLLVKPGGDDVIVDDWSGDGRFLVYGVEQRASTGWDVWVLPLAGGKPAPLLASRFRENQARVSPDSKHLAYTSDETGRSEVYLQDFPAGGGKVQVSVSGGSQPIWKRDGKELFFLADDSRLMAVPIAAAAERLEPGTPAPLFEFRVPMRGDLPARNVYTVSPDGKRFLVNASLQQTPPSLEVVLNWTSLRP